MTIIATKVKKSKKNKFLRLNIDEKLEKLLVEFENEFPLLSRVDIVRMILSKSISKKTNDINLSMSEILQIQEKNRSNYAKNLSDLEIENLINKKKQY